MSDNVVVISEIKPSLQPKKRSQKSGTLYCEHWRVWVDRHTRALECKDCGAVVDCFDYLMKCAEKERSLLETAHALRKEIEQLNTEIPRAIRRARESDGAA